MQLSKSITIKKVNEVNAKDLAHGAPVEYSKN